MKLRTSETIRSNRKRMNLTQEQLAEAVGVTVGAVSKWESGLSSPDITMLPILADFFEISIDVLLGYQLECRTVKSATEKIHNLCLLKKYSEGIVEAEKALQRFPNNFELVYQSAELYLLHGLKEKNHSSLQKSLDLYNQACTLISQNTDSKISELQIQSCIGSIYVSLGELDRGIEHLKKHNSCGINNGLIGFLLTQKEDYDEALPLLSDSLPESLVSLFRTSLGLALYYEHHKDYLLGIEVLQWMYDTIKGLKYPGRISYLDKVLVILLTACAKIAAAMKDEKQTEGFLKEALAIAEEYDAASDYSASDFKFYHGKDMSLGDDFGETALKGIEHSLNIDKSDNPILTTIWRKLNNE